MDKPFSIGYVMRTTVKHARQSVDVSINKTFARLPEFAEDPEKSQEVFRTLALLHNMRKLIDDFQSQNPDSFKGA